MFKFDIMFVGDDWFGNEKWKKFEEEFKQNSVKIVYFQYTRGTSSTKINNILDQTREDKP